MADMFSTQWWVGGCACVCVSGDEIMLCNTLQS